MNIVPIHKTDLDTCKILSQVSDDKVIEKITELLEWVQDINWPVAIKVCERLKDIGIPLVSPIRTILLGNDDIGKYCVISYLLIDASKETIHSLVSELENIAENPTEGEKAEEVNLAAREVLLKCL